MGKINYRKLLFIFIFWGGFIFSQNYTVYYNVKYQPKSDDSTKVMEKYILNINPETRESFFRFQSLTNSDFNANVFKNLSKNIFKQYEMILYKFYEFDYSLPTNWKLLPEKKIILGLNCQNASLSFGGREWTAWYATEIPVQDGPYKFSGLPGLILEIHSTDQEYQFYATGILKNHEKVKPLLAIPVGDAQKETIFKENIIKEPAAQFKQNLMQSSMKVSVCYNGKVSTDKEIIDSINRNFWEWIKVHNNPIEKAKIWIK